MSASTSTPLLMEGAAPGSLRGKNVVVTGANIGIGLETTFALARMGAKVFVSCRSKAKAVEAIDELVARGVDASLLEFVPIDLISLPTVKAFAQTLHDRGVKIDILVLNAGFMSYKQVNSDDGLESMFAVNHIGHFYLTRLLLDNGMLADDARIVVLSSDAAERGKFCISDSEIRTLKEGYMTGFQQYSNTKLYNAMFAFALQRRLRERHSKIDVFALHPGVVKSNFFNFGSGCAACCIGCFTNCFAITPVQGAQTSIYAASSPELTGKGGAFLRKSAISPLRNPLAHDVALQEELWSLSERLLHNDFTLARTSTRAAAAAAGADVAQVAVETSSAAAAPQADL